MGVIRNALRPVRIGAAFLSAVGARFGIWGDNTGPDSFKHFIEYTGEVNSFMPAFTIPFLAWAATIAETFLGITLVKPGLSHGCGVCPGGTQ
jgi:putative oxidoreductase